MKTRPEHSRDETLDTLFQGKLAIIQRKGGYRFSLDALLLAHFMEIQGREEIVDLGTGNGVIPLILASLYPSVRVIGLELQKEMVERALRSVDLNRLKDRVTVVEGDVCLIQQLFSPQSFDAVVCNPPYRGPKSGRINPDPERRVARHETMGCLRDFLRAGSYLLRHRGRMALSYPATRTVDLLKTMREEGVEPKRLRFVHSFEGVPASFLLAEGVKGGGSGLCILPPLVVYMEGRKYTAEIKAMLAGGPKTSNSTPSFVQTRHND